MSDVLTYQEIEGLLKYGPNETRPDIVELKQKLFEKFVHKALWQMRQDGVKETSEIEFQIDVKVAGVVLEAAKTVGGCDDAEITLGCCDPDGCGPCEPFNICLP